MPIYFKTTDFYRTINFYKKKKNWQTILEVAAENVAADIEDTAKRLAPKKTNRLANSIRAGVSTSGDKVRLTLGSSHPAATIIEFGGYSPFPPWGTESGLDFPVAKEIFENQPFKQPRPFIRPALLEGKDAIEGEIIRVAHEMGTKA